MATPRQLSTTDAEWSLAEQAWKDLALGHKVMVTVRRSKNHRDREYRLLYASQDGEELSECCRERLEAAIEPDEEIVSFWLYIQDVDKDALRHWTEQIAGKAKQRDQQSFQPVVLVQSTIPGHAGRRLSSDECEQLREAVLSASDAPSALVDGQALEDADRMTVGIL